MPRKRRPHAPAPQARLSEAFQRDLWRKVQEDLRKLQENPRFRFQLPDKLLDEIKRTDWDKLRQSLGADPDKFRKLAMSIRQQIVGSSAAPAAKPKQTRWRVTIPHADEAIDQMLAERQADPRKFRFVKAQRERVREILKKQHRQTVPNSQNRTLERMIAERRDKPDR